MLYSQQKKHYIFFFYFVVLISNLCFSQTKIIDSLQTAIRQHPEEDTLKIKLLNSIIYELREIDVKRTENFIVESIRLSEKLHFDKGKVEAIYYKGLLEITKSNYAKAIVDLEQALKIYKTLGNKGGVSYSLNGIGIAYYSQGDFAKAIEFYKKSLIIDQERNDQEGVSACLNNIGNVYADNGEYNKAIEYYTKAQIIKKKINDPYGVARAYNNIGIVYEEQGNFPKALESFNKALVMQEKAGNKLATPTLLNNIGEIYYSQDKLEEALVYFNKSLKIHTKQNNKKLIAESLYNIGNVYTKQSENIKAIEVLNKALVIYKKINDKPGVAKNIKGIGDVQLILKKKSIALEYYKKALDINTELNFPLGISKSHLGIATVYQKQQKYNEALYHAQESQKLAIKLKLVETQKNISKLLSEIYKNTKEYKNAYESHLQYKILNDSIFNKKSIQKLTQLEYEYKYQRQLDSANRRELKLIEKVKTTSKDLEITQRNYLWAIILFLSIVVVLGTITFTLKLRDVQSKNQRIIIEQKLLRSQMTPHFIFNSLSVLQGIILNKEEKKSVFYLSRFSKLLRIILENSRDKVVPLAKELIAIDHYLVLQNLDTKTPYDYKLILEKNIDANTFEIPPMVIQPFVENAIEHAFRNQKENRQIYIHIKFENKQLSCIITDNGIGIDTLKKKNNKNKKSLATTITSERLKMLSKDLKVAASLTIEDRKKYNQQGTLVTLVLPYKIIEND